MKRSLTLSAIVSVIFFNVSGGPYALEGALSAGAGLGLLLIVAAPLVWCAPIALICAELGSTLPEEGGYYAWAKRSCGSFGAFCQGAWAWLFAVVNIGLYPTMFCDYLAYFFPALGENGHFWLRKGLMLGMIWTFVSINMAGSKTVGNLARIFTFLVFAPFLIMVLIAAYTGFTNGFAFNPIAPFIAETMTFETGLAKAFPIVLWNYLGWDSASAIAGEMEHPRRDYPKALLLSMTLIAVGYVIPPLIANACLGYDAVVWKTPAWSFVAEQLGGRWLGPHQLHGNRRRIRSLFRIGARLQPHSPRHE